MNNEHRELHGALLDAQILAEVYLAMTGGQTSLLPDSQSDTVRRAAAKRTDAVVRHLDRDRSPLRVIRADDDECERHTAVLDAIAKASDQGCRWRQS